MRDGWRFPTVGLGFQLVAAVLASAGMPPFVFYTVSIVGAVLILFPIGHWIFDRLRASSRAEHILLNEAVEYITRRSRWAIQNQNDAEWYLTIQRDLHDALSMGEVRAYGRAEPQHGGREAGPFAPAIQSIPKDHWGTYRPAIFDGLAGNKTANFSEPSSGRGHGFYDIRLDGGDLRKKWPGMTLVQKRRHIPLRLTA